LHKKGIFDARTEHTVGDPHGKASHRFAMWSGYSIDRRHGHSFLKVKSNPRVAARIKGH